MYLQSAAGISVHNDVWGAVYNLDMIVQRKVLVIQVHAMKRVVPARLMKVGITMDVLK
jgi:hypothetical protein